MFGKIKNQPLALDDYETRLNRLKAKNKPDSIYASSLVANIATLLFVVIDFICMYTVWNQVQTESSVMLALLAGGCAVCLDVPLAIAGNALKRYHQKLADKSSTMIIMVLAIATFFITFVFSCWFRVETRDLSFDISSGSTLTNTLDNVVGENNGGNTVLVAALFNAIVPLATSIASFVISYFSADPLGNKIARLDKAIITVDSHITEINQVIKEGEEIDNYHALLIENETKKKENYIKMCKARGLLLKQVALIEIMRILKGADNVSYLCEAGKTLNEESGVDV